MGCDQQPALPRIKMHIFQSTHPVWDATRDIANEYARCLFQSTHPVWDATDVVVSSDLVHGISIHASRMGCDFILVETALVNIVDFNPRIPYGMRHGDLAVGVGRGGISIHASRMGCDVLHHVVGGGIGISIHASRMGCDPVAPRTARDVFHFNPRIPYGMRHEHARALLAGRQISIHASRMGCDTKRPSKRLATCQFQSTHPVWDATCQAKHQAGRKANFNPRIPYGMRLSRCDPRFRVAEFQSTHPVWDATFSFNFALYFSSFQSTHPVWDATLLRWQDISHKRISIHASRMGCD